eukprot:2281649-Amphidinium_carterae.1
MAHRPTKYTRNLHGTADAVIPQQTSVPFTGELVPASMHALAICLQGGEVPLLIQRSGRKQFPLKLTKDGKSTATK